MRIILSLISFALFQCAFAQKFEGLAMTPPMGWNSWNTFATNINAKLVMEIADDMVKSGMKDAGYSYIVLDDGWMAKERDPKTGNLVPDPEKFPDGLEPVVEYVHSKGLKFGLYNCAGTKTCAGYPGTRGYEYQDARWYASMRIDYLKYDWCYTEGINAKEAYATMSNAIKVAGRPIIFSLCEWGSNDPWEWAAPVGHLWRVSGDIYNCFDCIKNWGSWNSWGVTHIIDLRKNIRQFAGPDHWNDFDMMEVGHGMSNNEDRAHFSMWCMLASPLIAGNDLREMKQETIDILTNKEAIAINQDKLGVQAYLYQQKDSIDTWVKPLANGELAICFMNRSKTEQPLNFDWKMSILSDTVSKTTYDFSKINYTIKNVWGNGTMTMAQKSKQRKLPDTSEPIRLNIPGHDVVLLRLKPVVQ
ncbi:MAG TPA: glycoside hydrolase family 27 protein [Chitinophagaceae bacterium]|nr:glycoside hydrolase family 27 protein [Chitinophagaceae bacterium]